MTLYGVNYVSSVTSLVVMNYLHLYILRCATSGLCFFDNNPPPLCIKKKVYGEGGGGSKKRNYSQSMILKDKRDVVNMVLSDLVSKQKEKCSKS